MDPLDWLFGPGSSAELAEFLPLVEAELRAGHESYDRDDLLRFLEYFWETIRGDLNPAGWAGSFVRAYRACREEGRINASRN